MLENSYSVSVVPFPTQLKLSEERELNMFGVFSWSEESILECLELTGFKDPENQNREQLRV